MIVKVGLRLCGFDVGELRWLLLLFGEVCMCEFECLFVVLLDGVVV